MKSYEGLEKEFQNKVSWLQKHCLHKDTTIMESIGFGCLENLLVCKYCRKILERKIISHPLNSTTTTTNIEWRGTLVC